MNYSGLWSYSSPFFYVLVLVDLILRGLALYKSARREEKVWFVFLLIINSVGILPLVYLLIHKDINLKSLGLEASKTKKSSKK